MALSSLKLRNAYLCELLLFSSYLVMTDAGATEQEIESGAVLPAIEMIQKRCDAPSRWFISGVVQLQPNCIYNSTISITESHTNLDCQGSVIDPGKLGGYALHIDSQGRELIGVSVQNCIIRNSNAIGLVIGWQGSDREKTIRYTREEIYKRTPHDIKIINTWVDSAKGAGIFIDDYVSYVTLQNVTVTRSDAMAVYLEHSSQHITIEHSLFADNGQRKKREALAIDSSALNVVRHNTFRRNRAGSIFLYKNCHEHASFDLKQVKRWQGSDNNLIENNYFEDELVGVWVGSRQSVDLRKLRCGDPYYGEKFVMDKARENTVRDNEFLRVTKGILVEDDNNAVVMNRFMGAREVCIRVGSGPRSSLMGLPVAGVDVSYNECGLGSDVEPTLRMESPGIEFIHGSSPRK
jgi:hypothetical protein